MEQFRQIGEALGSLKAVMVFRENIQVNQRQCCLLMDVYTFAYDSIADEMRQNLKFEEKNGKWKIIEQPLREIHRIFKEGEAYIKHCLETKDWWVKAITLCHNTDCVEFYIHNLLCCMPIVIEAIESAGETSASDQEEMQRKRLVNSMKYRKEYRDMNLFQWKYGKLYLITQDLCSRYDTVWREDRWFLFNKVKEKKLLGVAAKYERKLLDLLSSNLERSESLERKLLPSSILVGSKDYQVRRRMGNGSQYKEIIWLGESFVIRHFFGDIEALEPEIQELLSLCHPNIMDYLCGFVDEEKKECFLLMELMSKTLSNHIKEINGQRKRVPFLLHVAVDLMLQIARGMEYLHSKKVYHGELNPSNILVKYRGTSPEGYLHAKVFGFGLSSVKDLNQNRNTNQNGTFQFIWYSPEVLEEQEQSGGGEASSKYTEKSDVYSFGMVCFELITGKVPFDDSHLQGEKMSRNIRAGERPLFPLNSPKYVINLTKRCWHTDPNQRPTFSSICRILRYIKRFLAMNPGYSYQAESPPVPLVDYCDIESVLLRKFPWGSSELAPLSQIPFQMYAYRVIEREKLSTASKENSESGSDASACGDELATSGDEPMYPLIVERKPSAVADSMNRRLTLTRKSLDIKLNKQPGTPKGQSARPPQMSPSGRRIRANSDMHLLSSPRGIRRTSSGHVSDSELT